MTDFLHLTPETRLLLTLSDDERIFEMNKDRWIGYAHAEEGIRRLEDLLAHPIINRMPNMLLIARSNNGKTHLLKRFEKLHPASDNCEGDAIKVPVLYVKAPAAPDEKRLYSEILDLLFAKYSLSDQPQKLLQNLREKFRKVGVRMLLIDEIHNLLSGSPAKQRQFLTVLKNLCNDLQIVIVVAGTEDASRALQTDPQLANRFEPFVLPRWSFDTEYRRLLMSYEQLLPLKFHSKISEKLIANKIWALSEGSIGETVKLLKKAAEYAIQNKHEKIDEHSLINCAYKPQTVRKTQSTLA